MNRCVHLLIEPPPLLVEQSRTSRYHGEQGLSRSIEINTFVMKKKSEDQKCEAGAWKTARFCFVGSRCEQWSRVCSQNTVAVVCRSQQSFPFSENSGLKLYRCADWTYVKNDNFLDARLRDFRWAQRAFLAAPYLCDPHSCSQGP